VAEAISEADCNVLLQPVRKELISERLQPETKQYYDEFCVCPGCSRVYWKAHEQFIPVGFCREKAVIGAVPLFLLRGGLQLQKPSTPHWEVGAQ